MTTILVADDDTAIWAILKRTLDHLGYTTTVVGNGRQALAQIVYQPQAFACVMLDVNMPSMGGMDAAQEIRQHAPDVPIVLMTGYDNVDVPPSLDHITLLKKPFDLDTLRSALRSAIS